MGGWADEVVGGAGEATTPPAHSAGVGGSEKRCGPPLGCPLTQACIIDARGWAGVGH